MRGTGGDGQTDGPPQQCGGTHRSLPGQGQTLQAVVKLPPSVCPSTPQTSLRCPAVGDGTQFQGVGHPPVNAPPLQCTL